MDVVYTTYAGTRQALEKAWVLAQGLGAHIRLVFIHSVPYALPLTAPAVSLPFLQDKLIKLASSYSSESSVSIYLCRDTFRALPGVLRQSSLVVLAGRRRWWLTKEERLEKQLKKLGHEVIFVQGR